MITLNVTNLTLDGGTIVIIIVFGLMWLNTRK